MSNPIPAGWNLIPIADICNIAIGGTPSRSVPEYWDSAKTSGSPWVSIRDLNKSWICETSEYITDLGIEKSNVKLVKKGTVLMSFKLSVGRVAYAGRDLYTNEAIVAFLPKIKNTLSNQFLYQGLQHWDLLVNIDQAVKGITLNKDKINHIETLLPPLPEQQKIATILSSVDDVIEKIRAQIDKLKDLKTGMMQELLTKGIGHAEFKDSPVGRIPAEWDVVSIESITTDVTYGLTVRPKYIDEGVPLVSGKECKDGWLDFSISNRISELDFAGLRERALPSTGDVIMTKTGTVGRVALVRSDYPKFAISQNVALIKPDHSKVEPEYLSIVLTSEWVKEQIRLGVSTLSVPDLQLGTLKNFIVPLPSIAEQCSIVSFINGFNDKKTKSEERLRQLELLKKALMQDLLTGKVRVKLTDKESAVV